MAVKAKEWKVIHTDNFGGDYPNEKFVTELPVMTEAQANGIANAINTNCVMSDSPRYYRAVPGDYKLVPGFAP